MRLFSIKTGGRILRIRKEEFGCAILDKDTYVEGNDIVYKVLEKLSQGRNLEETICALSQEENVPIEEVREDVLSLMKMFNEMGWFCELTQPD